MRWASAPGDRAGRQVREPDEFGLNGRDPRHAGTKGDEAGLDRHGESDGRPSQCPRALHVHGLGWSSIGLRRSLVRGREAGGDRPLARARAELLARGPSVPECAREIERDPPLRLAIAPATHLLRPHVGLASGAGLPVRLDARGPGVDQGHVAQHAVGTSSMARLSSGEDLASVQIDQVDPVRTWCRVAFCKSSPRNH